MMARMPEVVRYSGAARILVLSVPHCSWRNALLAKASHGVDRLVKPKSSHYSFKRFRVYFVRCLHRYYYRSPIMLVSLPSSQPCDNRLLDLLSTDEYRPLAPYLEKVDLNIKDTIGERGQPIQYIFFPCTAVLSVLNLMLDGQAVEVGTIGNEGFYGIDVLIGSDLATDTSICQIKGKALRMPVADFKRAVDGNTPLRRVTQRFLQAYLSMVSQSVACNRLHTIEARFARWVLMTHDRVLGNDFYLTQEFMASMLGVHRPSISLVAGAFQQAGMIRYSRGHMTILKRDALEEICCECYDIVNKQYERTVGLLRGGRLEVTTVLPAFFITLLRGGPLHAGQRLAMLP
jgi:CRP-like cAMP-binding protein